MLRDFNQFVRFVMKNWVLCFCYFDLKKKLKSADRQVIVTTIQKMQILISKRLQEGTPDFDKIKNLRVAFVVDECHRAVTPKTKRELERFFGRSLWYGFTGTPRFAENPYPQMGDLPRTTEELYGKCLHSYTIQNAIHDKAVLGFQVEHNGPKNMTDETDSSQYDNEAHMLKVLDVILNKSYYKLGLQNGKGMTYECMLTTKSIQEVQSYYGMYGMYGYAPQQQEQEVEGSGSGIIVGKNDDELLIATNYHVVEGADTLSVAFTDGNAVEASVKGFDEERDLAVVSVSLDDVEDDTMDAISIANIGSSDDLKVGEQVIAIGNALGYGQSVTTGIVSAKNRRMDSDNNTVTDGSDDSSVNGAFTMIPSAQNPYVGALHDKSYALGEAVINAYCESCKIKNSGVQIFDNMTGINWSTVPVIILEMGFMSNESDDTNMENPDFQKLMVQGIANGIDAYFAAGN